MAVKANLVVDQGTDFTANIELEDNSGSTYDLTGYTVAAQMRKNYTSSAAVTFGATTNGAGGTVFLSLTHTQTSAIEPGRYLYDVEITSAGGTVTRVVEGIVTVTPSMTRV